MQIVCRHMSGTMGLLLGWMMAIGLTAPAAAESIPVNSVNYNQVIKGGTYANRIGEKTVFYNQHGLWLKSGTTVRGVEMESNGRQNGNGGNLLLKAPNSVVRLDGDINVNGFSVPGPSGRAGNVTIDAAYLYQSGNIFAQGTNGSGTVNINVNSATFTPTARIDVSSPDYLGGNINIKANAVVDLQRNGSQMAQLNTSSHVNYVPDTNLIDIRSGMINNLGVIRADGIDGGPGGTIKLTASGPINVQPSVDALNNTQVFSSCQATAIANQLNRLQNKVIPIERNTVWNNGVVSADGGNSLSPGGVGGKGGDIIINAANFVNGSGSADPGSFHANGGNGYDRGGDGGTITATMSRGFADVVGKVSVDGGNGTGKVGAYGGNGGTIKSTMFFFANFTPGVISANGGNGNAPQGNGGNGGLVYLRADKKYIVSNDNIGKLEAKGGNGGGGVFSKGGLGGKVVQGYITNEVNGTTDTSPGHP